MDPAALERRAESLREEIEATAARFAEAARPALERWLTGAVERLVVAQADRVNELNAADVAALRRGVREAVARAGAAASNALADPELWLHPTVALDRDPGRELGEANHRIWIALLRAIRSLDPVLTEFGMASAPVPAFGGARFGLEPRRLGDLDRGGALARMWDRYLDLYVRYTETIKRIPEEERRRDREEALRRWRQPD